jgi:hypothetical protein
MKLPTTSVKLNTVVVKLHTVAVKLLCRAPKLRYRYQKLHHRVQKFLWREALKDRCGGIGWLYSYFLSKMGCSLRRKRGEKNKDKGNDENILSSRAHDELATKLCTRNSVGHQGYFVAHQSCSVGNQINLKEFIFILIKLPS